MVVGELGSCLISKYLHFNESPPASVGRFGALVQAWKVLPGRKRHSFGFTIYVGPTLGLCISRTLFGINLIVVDEVTEVTWPKQWRGGPRKNSSPMAYAWGLPLTCCMVCG